MTTKLAIDMVFAAIAPSEMKRKSEKAPSFYEVEPASPKRRKRACKYLIKHNANKLFVMDTLTLPVTDDGMLYALEFICVITNQSKANAVKKLARLNPEWFQDHAQSIKVLSFDKALIVSMLITGQIASALRLKFGSHIARYIAGETSLVEDRAVFEQRMMVFKSPTGDIEAYDPEAVAVAVPCDEGTSVELSSGAFLCVEISK